MAAIAPYQVDSGDGETSVSKNYHKGSKLPALLASAYPFNGETIHPTNLLKGGIKMFGSCAAHDKKMV